MRRLTPIAAVLTYYPQMLYSQNARRKMQLLAFLIVCLHFVSGEVVRSDKQRHETFKTPKLTSGQYTFVLNLELPGEVHWHSESSQIFQADVTTYSSNATGLDDIDVIFNLDVTNHVVSLDIRPRQPRSALFSQQSQGQKIRQNPFLHALLALLLYFTQRRSVLPLLVVLAATAVGFVCSSWNQGQDHAIVNVYMPVNFYFKNVLLSAPAGKIVVDRKFFQTNTAVRCSTGKGGECSKCCHGNGVCHSGNRCKCSDGFSEKEDCALTKDEYTLFTNAGDRRVMETETPDGDTITAYGEKAENGSLKSIRSLRRRDVSGRETTVEFDHDNRIIWIRSSTGSQLEMYWVDKSHFRVRGLAFNKRRQVVVDIKGPSEREWRRKRNVGEEEESRNRKQREWTFPKKRNAPTMVYSVDRNVTFHNAPPRSRLRSLNLSKTKNIHLSRKNRNFRDEIETPKAKGFHAVKRGRKGKKFRSANKKSKSFEIKGARTSTSDPSERPYIHIPVSVTRCGKADQNARVHVVSYHGYGGGKWAETEKFEAVAAKQPGQFYVQLPNRPVNLSRDSSDCYSVPTVMLETCLSLPPSYEDFRQTVCESTREAFDASRADIGIDDYMTTCRRGFRTVVDHCRTASALRRAGGCGGFRRVDSYSGELLLQPVVEFPGSHVVRGPRRRVRVERAPLFHRDGGFELEDDRSKLEVVGFSVEPKDPMPKQGYTVSTEYVCATDNTTARMVATGTDGYRNNATCAGVPTCSCCVLHVAGAAASVVDKVRVALTDSATDAEFTRVVYVVF